MLSPEEKIKGFDEIGNISSRLRAEGRVVVFTNGCFDILHAGHISYLWGARLKGDVLIVGLNSDSSVRVIKGDGRPINPEKDRALVLASLYFVDYVVVFGEETPMELIKIVRPHVLVKGADWRDKGIVGSEFVESYGGRCEFVDLLKGRSTTGIIRKILHGFSG